MPEYLNRLFLVEWDDENADAPTRETLPYADVVARYPLTAPLLTTLDREDAGLTITMTTDFPAVRITIQSL